MTGAQPPGNAHGDPLLRAVAEHWVEIQRLASHQQRVRLMEILQGISGPEAAEARAALADELLDLLPPGHPVIGVLRSGVLYSRAPLGQADGYSIVAPADAGTMTVTIYIDDERIHGQVEAAVETLLAAAGLLIDARGEPVIGSWFRRLVARAKDDGQPSRDLALSAAHTPGSRPLLAHDPAVTAQLLQNLAPVLGVLQPTRNAAIRAGAVLIVKADWAVSVFQLTAAQQARLDNSPHLARSPHEIIAALSLAEDDSPGWGAGHAALAGYDATATLLRQDGRFLRETTVSFGRPQVAPVADDELAVLPQRRPDLHRLRLTAVVLPFDLEEPPEGYRYLETTVRMTFDSPDVRSLRLSRPAADAGSPDDSVLDTRGVGRPQLTWKLTARSEQAGLRPSGREVLAVIESPPAPEQLTGTLDASVRLARRLPGHDWKSETMPCPPIRFSLNMADGTFEVLPEWEIKSGR